MSKDQGTAQVASASDQWYDPDCNASLIIGRTSVQQVNAMPRFLNKIYVKYIRPTDPGLFIARYAGKAGICCLVAFVVALVAGIEERHLFWWMVGSICTVLFSYRKHA